MGYEGWQNTCSTSSCCWKMVIEGLLAGHWGLHFWAMSGRPGMPTKAGKMMGKGEWECGGEDYNRVVRLLWEVNPMVHSWYNLSFLQMSRSFCILGPVLVKSLTHCRSGGLHKVRGFRIMEVETLNVPSLGKGVALGARCRVCPKGPSICTSTELCRWKEKSWGNGFWIGKWMANKAAFLSLTPNFSSDNKDHFQSMHPSVHMGSIQHIFHAIYNFGFSQRQ